MRLAIALLVAALATTAFAAPVGAAGKPPLTTVTMTGRVAAVDMTHIAVGRLHCLLGPRTVALANTFAVGENVTVRCIGPKLASIVFTPVTNGHALPPIHISGPTPNRPAPTVLKPVSSVSVHGAITAITAYSVSIGDVTCDIGNATITQLGLGVGDVIGMGCSTYADGTQTSQIVLPVTR